jgi:hypothetical protein
MGTRSEWTRVREVVSGLLGDGFDDSSFVIRHLSFASGGLVIHLGVVCRVC